MEPPQSLKNEKSIRFTDELTGDSFFVFNSLREVLDGSRRLKTAQTKEKKRLLEREAKLVRSFRHPNIESYEKLARSKSIFVLSCSRAGSVTLHDLIQHSNPRAFDNIDPDTFFIVARQCVMAMMYLHDVKHVYHGDVSPNIIVLCRNWFDVSTLEESVRIKISGSSFGNATTESMRNESDGSALFYRSPEAILEYRKGGFSSAKHDVWCLGATLYHFCTGRLLVDLKRPFKNDQFFFDKRGAISENAPLLEMELRIRRAIDTAFVMKYGMIKKSKSVWRLLRKMLQFDPDLRSDIAGLMKIKRLNIGVAVSQTQ